MKKFLLELGCFAIGLFIAITIINYAYMVYLKKTNIYQTQMPEQIAVAAVGNSHLAWAFTFPGSREYNGTENVPNTFNFGMSSQSFFYDDALITHYLDQIDNGAVVFVDGSYEKLFYDEMDGTLYEKNSRYYEVLSTDEMRFFRPLDKFRGYYQVLYKINHDISYVFNLNQVHPIEENENLIVEDTIDEAVVEENLHYLTDLIQKCQEKDARVIVVTTPFQKAYIEELSDEVMNRFDVEISKLQETYGVEYWDYGRNNDYMPENFIDSHHLSNQGAHRFTQEMLERIGYKPNK